MRRLLRLIRGQLPLGCALALVVAMVVGHRFPPAPAAAAVDPVPDQTAAAAARLGAVMHRWPPGSGRPSS